MLVGSVYRKSTENEKRVTPDGKTQKLIQEFISAVVPLEKKLQIELLIKKITLNWYARSINLPEFLLSVK